MTETKETRLGRARRGVVLIAAVAAIASSAPAGAGTAVNTGYFGGVAIEGYDTVVCGRPAGCKQFFGGPGM